MLHGGTMYVPRRCSPRCSLDRADNSADVLLNRVGYGRTGDVYRAVAEGAAGAVAIKVCRSEREGRESLMNEVTVLRDLSSTPGEGHM